MKKMSFKKEYDYYDDYDSYVNFNRVEIYVLRYEWWNDVGIAQKKTKVTAYLLLDNWEKSCYNNKAVGRESEQV
mgnify:CR=1 FL=1